MNEVSVMLVMGIFLLTLLVSSRFFYLLEVKYSGKKIVNSLHINILELNYSFEQMVYFYTLPSNISIIKEATIENITIDFDYDSLLFSYLKGIKIHVQSDHEKILLAYLAAKDFRLPSLDLLLEEGKLDNASYLKVSIYKLIHQQTLDDITEEVYKQIQVGRYDQVEGG